MLVNMREMLLQAEQGHYAIGCFNTPNIETVQAVIAAAEEEKMPVILSHAQSMDPPAAIEEISAVMIYYAKAASVPVCVHLDHGMDWDYVNRAMSLGFTSVMFDLSEKPFNENAEAIATLCRIAHSRGITVEAELGRLTAGMTDPHGCTPGTESSFSSLTPADCYTDPAQAAEFVLRTGVDALTVCFGTAHGQYKFPPKLDIERVNQIRERLDGRCRIVMHGASGVDNQQIQLAIQAGVSKINYYSGISRGCSKYIYSLMQQCNGNMHWHMVHKEAAQFMKEHIREKICLFSGKESNQRTPLCP